MPGLVDWHLALSLPTARPGSHRNVNPFRINTCESDCKCSF